MTNKKTAGKNANNNGVVLNLTTEQANNLMELLQRDGTTETAEKLAKRIEKVEEECVADPLGLTHCECKKCKAKEAQDGN